MRTHARTGLLALVAAAVAAVLVSPVAPARADTPPLGPHYTWSKTPSKVWLQRPDDSFVRLRPWTSCWQSPPQDGEVLVTCSDGFPPGRDEMRRLTDSTAARFWFGRPGWEFEASITSLRSPDDESCRSQVDVHHPRPRWFQLPRPERPGVYEVELFGQGPEGDVFVTFKWRVGRWDHATAC